MHAIRRFNGVILNNNTHENTSSHNGKNDYQKDVKDW